MLNNNNNINGGGGGSPPRSSVMFGTKITCASLMGDDSSDLLQQPTLSDEAAGFAMNYSGLECAIQQTNTTVSAATCNKVTQQQQQEQQQHQQGNRNIQAAVSFRKQNSPAAAAVAAPMNNNNRWASLLPLEGLHGAQMSSVSSTSQHNLFAMMECRTVSNIDDNNDNDHSPGGSASLRKVLHCLHSDAPEHQHHHHDDAEAAAAAE